MKLYNIRHPDHFFRILETCQGPVLFTAQDGSLVDLQEYRRHTRFDRVLEEVELHTVSSQDACLLLRYSQEACRS